MQAALLRTWAEEAPQARDTRVDPQVSRRHSLPGARGASVAKQAPRALSLVAPRRGGEVPAMVPASLYEVQVREAIVKREAPGRAPTPRPGAAMVAIDFARSRDAGLRVTREGKDTVRLTGYATGGALSVVVEGVLFTTRTLGGELLSEVVARLLDRLEPHFELAVTTSEFEATVRLVRPRL